MMGVTHGAGGAAAGLLIGAPCPPSTQMLCGGAGYLAAYRPDLDHPQSTASRWLKVLGLVVFGAMLALGAPLWAAVGLGLVVAAGSHLLRAISVACDLPKHRGLTHTWRAMAVLDAVLFAVLCGLFMDFWPAVVMGIAAFAGYCAALWQDWVTVSSLPWVKWYPGCDKEQIKSDGPPEALRLTTGGGVEGCIAFPLALIAGVGAVLLGTII